MSKLITIAELQRNTSPITKATQKQAFIVTSHGRGRSILLPYFEGNELAIDRYWEDWEMNQNKEALKARYKESIESGPSSLGI